MDLQNTFENGRKLVEDFLSGNKHYFSTLKPSDIPDKLPGIYAIFTATETLYVGRTTNLRRRLYTNHLMGPIANARLKKYLIEDETCFPNITGPAEAKLYLKDHCYVQFISVDTVIERGKIEGLLSYALNVKYLYEEH